MGSQSDSQPDSQANNTSPRRILLACPQRIGDVLLATPLARSLKRAWPDATVDMLVFEGSEGVLTGNSDLGEIVVVPRRADFTARLSEMRRLWRVYDLALSPLPTDRARLYCWAAGRHRLGMLSPGIKDRAKKLLVNRHVEFDDLHTHTVTMGLRLAETLGIQRCFEVVPPGLGAKELTALLPRLAPLAGVRFAVLHTFPKFAYKMWPSAAWVELTRWLDARGIGVLFTGGADAGEVAYVDAIVRQLPADLPRVNLAGRLSLAETTELIRRACLYVGPDTAVTHIAASTGTPTVALFGPSNPVKWGPWPHDWRSAASPWTKCGSGRQGNVFLLQGPGDCVPCMLEGCHRHVDSGSDCLDQLTVATVAAAAHALLEEPPRRA